jgi:predicted dehydrogenase
MQQRLKWGILGTGNIARQFCVGVNSSQRGSLAAVGSRTAAAAQQFAAVHRISGAYGSYDRLLADPDVQAVYISLPNTLHHPWTLAALKAGKHVLCEKPLAVSVAQAREMFALAAERNLHLVEAFMYRAHPQTTAVRQAVRGGKIGTLKMIRTSFCYRTTKTVGQIRFDPQLAGGALMDVGCYCIDFARFITGEDPTDCFAVAHPHPQGVDEMVVGSLSFPSGVLASFTCGMAVQSFNAAFICGTEGYLEIPIPWKPPAGGTEYHLIQATPPRQDQQGLAAMASVPNSGPRQTFHIPATGDLYALEADAFAATVLDGQPSMMTAAESMGNLRVLETLQRQISRPHI